MSVEIEKDVPPVGELPPETPVDARNIRRLSLTIRSTTVRVEVSLERLLMSIMHDCLTGIDGLYNPLLLGAVNDTEDLAASATDLAPGMWSNPLPDSANGFGEVISESALATTDFGCSEFPHICNVEDPPTSFADVELSQYQDV